MAITSRVSHLPTLDEFIPHWAAANAALAASGPLVLEDGYDLDGLKDLREALATQRTLVQRRRVDLRGSRADLASLRTALLKRLNQFNRALKAYAPKSRWTRLRPKAYVATGSFDRVLPPLETAAFLWENFETHGPMPVPVRLAGDYGLAAFQADVTAMDARFTAHRCAVMDVRLELAERDILQEKARAVLAGYRAAVLARFLPGAPVLETLPRLTPARSRRPKAPPVPPPAAAPDGEELPKGAPPPDDP